MNIKKLVEEINRLAEDELIDDFEGIDVPNEPVAMPEPFDLTSELNAKTKISRALDVLIDAIDDFKNSVTQELDLIQDADLTASFELLDEVTSQILSVISGDDKSILPASEIEPEDEEIEDDQEDEEIEDDQEDEEIDFDAEAELDLFSNEDNEQDKESKE